MTLLALSNFCETLSARLSRLLFKSDLAFPAEGRPERLLLGWFSDLSIELACKEAMKAKGAVAGGVNTQKEKRAIRDEMTFGALFEQYLEKYSKGIDADGIMMSAK